jgi:hypothetical protein
MAGGVSLAVGSRPEAVVLSVLEEPRSEPSRPRAALLWGGADLSAPGLSYGVPTSIV